MSGSCSTIDAYLHFEDIENGIDTARSIHEKVIAIAGNELANKHSGQVERGSEEKIIDAWRDFLNGPYDDYKKKLDAVE